MLLSLESKKYDRMTEIVITIMILVSALAIRDAIIYECSKRECIKRLSPMQFAIASLLVALLVLWILIVPLRRYITGESSAINFYDRIISVVVSVAFLICALSLREASSEFFDESNTSTWTPWLWSFLVVFSTTVLIFTVFVCKS